MRDVSPLRQAGDFGGCTKNLRHDAWRQPSPTSRRLRRLHQKTCAMMRDVSPLRQAGDFSGCTKNPAP